MPQTYGALCALAEQHGVKMTEEVRALLRAVEAADSGGGEPTRKMLWAMRFQLDKPHFDNISDRELACAYKAARATAQEETRQHPEPKDERGIPMEVLRITYAPDLSSEEFARIWPEFKAWQKDKQQAEPILDGLVALPEKMPTSIYRHENLGDLYDRLAVHKYAISYANKCLLAQKAPPQQPVRLSVQIMIPEEWPTDRMMEAGRRAADSHGPLLGSGQSLWHVFRDMLAAGAQP